MLKLIINLIKTVCIYGLLISYAPLASMDRSKPDISIKRRWTGDYAEAKRLLEPMGYSVSRRAHANDYEITWVSIRRSEEDRVNLQGRGFSHSDIDQLTIRNIQNPLADRRILDANRPDLGHPVYRFSFALFQSRLLWPTTPTEADLLMLIPDLGRIDPASINVEIGDYTLLGLAVASGYHRAVEMLLHEQDIDINRRVAGNMSPLEAALARRDTRMVALLLQMPDLHITQRARDLAAPYVDMTALLNTRSAQTANRFMEWQGILRESGIGYQSIPYFTRLSADHPLLNRHKALHKKFINEAKAQGRQYPEEPRPSWSKPFKWALGIPIVGLAVKALHGSISDYIKASKKSSEHEEITS